MTRGGGIFINRFVAIATALLLSAAAASTNAAPFDDTQLVQAPVDPVALAFVRETDVGLSLVTLLTRMLNVSDTVRGLRRKEGDRAVDASLMRQVKRAWDTYRTPWERHLAVAYLEHFTSGELESLRIDREKSPYYRKLLQRKAAVGKSMRVRSQELLVDILAEVADRLLKDFVDET